MSKTVFITGASSGIGRATAKLFQSRGWNVVATMRTPDSAGDLGDLDNVLIARLDVTRPDTIAAAHDEAISRFGLIDALVNNAGYGAYGPLEAFSMEAVRRQFDTNVIGLLETTKQFLPHLRTNGAGVIVNISSIGGRMAFPLGTLYHGSKFAVEGLSEALHYELEALGVRVKLVEPGMTQTDFGGRSFDFANDEALEQYQPVVQAQMAMMRRLASRLSLPETPAEVIWEAVNDDSSRLRYRSGEDAEAILDRRERQDDATFFAGLKAMMEA